MYFLVLLPLVQSQIPVGLVHEDLGNALGTSEKLQKALGSVESLENNLNPRKNLRKALGISENLGKSFLSQSIHHWSMDLHSACALACHCLQLPFAVRHSHSLPLA